MQSEMGAGPDGEISVTTTNRCRCGRPSPDGFLCRTCADQLTIDLEALSHYLPELAATLIGQANTRRHTRATQQANAATETPTTAPVKLPAHLRTSAGPIALVATGGMFDEPAADLLGEARNTLITWCRHLCEARGIPIERILEAA